MCSPRYRASCWLRERLDWWSQQEQREQSEQSEQPEQSEQREQREQRDLLV